MPTYLSCHYCNIETSRFEKDHFPIPYELYGERMVPACEPCHSAKDRARMEDVLPSVMRGAHKFDPHELVQKAFVDPVSDTAAWADACWEEWTREQRILVARILRARYLQPFFEQKHMSIFDLCGKTNPEMLEPMSAEYTNKLNRRISMLDPELAESWHTIPGKIRKSGEEESVPPPAPIVPVKVPKKRGCGLVAHTRPNKKK